MPAKQWYELRARGSIGTREGEAWGATEGVAISDDGHLCPVGSAHVLRFESEQAALEYLARCTVPGKSDFEVVVCRPGIAEAPPLDKARSRSAPVPELGAGTAA